MICEFNFRYVVNWVNLDENFVDCGSVVLEYGYLFWSVVYIEVCLEF